MQQVVHLQLYIKYLAQAINDCKPGVDYRCKLQKLHSMLANTHYECGVKVDPKFYPCSFCQKPCDFDQSFKLYCEHLICNTDCLLTLIESCMNGDIIEYPNALCPECGSPITKDYVILAFDNEANFRRRLQQDSKKREPQYDCEICYGVFAVSDLITLDCGHRYCGDCIREYLTININEGKVAEDILVCPNDKKQISLAIIQHYLTPGEMEKFERFRLNQWRPDDLDAVHFKCKGVDCEYMELVSNERDSITCPLCNLTACPRCNLEPHPNKSCELMMRIARAKEDDGELGEFMRQSNVYRCPHCNTIIEKKGGCKYMTCTSQTCKGKRYFCVDCMQKLESPHQVHECITPDLLRRRCSVF